MQKIGRGLRSPSRSTARSRTETATSGVFYLTAVLSLVAVPAVASATELPDDLWSGKYGGFPSVTADSKGHVSLEVPAEAVEAAGGGAVADLAKDFLEKWASASCFGVFDFQSPHKNLKVQVALLKSARKVVIADVPGSLYEASDYIDVVIDYNPKNTAKCSGAPGS